MNTLVIDTYSGSTRIGCSDTINIIRNRIHVIRNKMKSLRILLSNQEKMDLGMLENYQHLNEDLRRLKIYEAEFVHTRNML